MVSCSSKSCQFCNILFGCTVAMQRTIGNFNHLARLSDRGPSVPGLVSCRVLAKVWLDVDA
jgi:hypothetical protein